MPALIYLHGRRARAILGTCVLQCKMASNWQKVKEELTCAICQGLLKEPKILPCLHSFCTGCLKEWSGRLANLDPSKCHLAECPLCRAKVLLSTSRAVEELPSHFSAIRLVEIVRLQEQDNSKEVIPRIAPICQSCDEGINAISICSDCAVFLCDFCVKSHQRVKSTKGHKLRSLALRRGTSESVPSILPEKVEMCPTHPTEPLELYCKCEEVLICCDCIIKNHKDHDYDVISDVVEGEKKILREALPGIKQLVGEVENAVTRVKGRRKDVKNRKEESLRNLDNAFSALYAALDERKRQLREKVTEDSKEKDKGLQVQEDELCILLSQLKSCHSFIEDNVQQGVDQDVLAMKRSMLERRDKLREMKREAKLDPIVKYPLAVGLKHMDEVIKSISKFE